MHPNSTSTFHAQVQTLEEPDPNNKDERGALQTEGSVPPLHQSDSQTGRAVAYVARKKLPSVASCVFGGVVMREAIALTVNLEIVGKS